MRVRGKVAPETEKPAPEMAAELTVIAAVPVEESVIDWIAAELTETLPNVTLDALTLSVGTAAFSCKANDCETLPAVAVRVAVCAVETADAVAEKLVLIAPAATVTDAGTVTAVLLLARFTTSPPLAGAALSVTEQASVPVPVIEVLVQEKALSTGTPVPARPIALEAPDEELLARVSVPAAAPAAAGSN